MERIEKKRLSGAERDANYASKMREKDEDDWLEKGRTKRKNYLERMSEAARDELRRKDRERKKKQRAESRERKALEEKEESSYKTPAALGKAQTKAMRALPSDPERAQEVVSGLQRIVDKAVGRPKQVIEHNPDRQILRMNGELRKQIVDFYYQPDISYTCPGKKDYVMLKKKDGSRIKATKYILVLTVSEAHSEFLKSEPNAKIGLDTFARLRPANVLLRHSLPKNVCVCIYHANINFLISALHKQNHRFPTDHKELIKLTSCLTENLDNADCQLGSCAQCAHLGTVEHLLQLLGTSDELAQNSHANHLWWEKEADQENKERLRKVEKRHINLYTIVLQLNNLLRPFKLHVLVKHHQEVEFNLLRTCKLPTNLLLQFDFSENCEIQEQDEVQTAHWWHLQVSLFTACAWVQGAASSFVVVSDYMHHDKLMTTIAIVKIMKELLVKYPNINMLNLFSDGASQHFKQRYFFNAVTMLPIILGLEQLKIVYDFFATSHGKGAVDGIGGSAKRGVMAKILSRKAIVKTAEEFASTGAAACPGIQFIYVSKQEVEGYREELDEIAFSGARYLPGIRKVHHMEVCHLYLNILEKSIYIFFLGAR